MLVIHGSWGHSEGQESYSGFFLWTEYTAGDYIPPFQEKNLRKRKRHPFQPTVYESCQMIDSLWSSVGMQDFGRVSFNWLNSLFTKIKIPTLPNGYPLQHAFLDRTTDGSREDIFLREWEIKCLELSRNQTVAFLLALARIKGKPDSYHNKIHQRIKIGEDLFYWSSLTSRLLDLVQKMGFIPSIQERSIRENHYFRSEWVPLDDGKVEEVLNEYSGLIPYSSLLFSTNESYDPKTLLRNFSNWQFDNLVRNFYPENYRSSYNHYDSYFNSRDAISDVYEQWYENLGKPGSFQSLRGNPVEIRNLKIKLDGWADAIRNSEFFNNFSFSFKVFEPGMDSPGQLSGDSWKILMEVTEDNQGMSDPIDSGDRIYRPRDNPDLFRFIKSRLETASGLSPFIENAKGEMFANGFVEVSTTDAFFFLRRDTPSLINAGFKVKTPEWWGRTSYRHKLVMDVDSGKEKFFSMDTLIKFDWRIAISGGGRNKISIDGKSFRELVDSKIPLARVGNRWIELDEQMISKASKFIEKYGASDSIPAMEIVRLSISPKAPAHPEIPEIGSIKGDLSRAIRSLKEQRYIEEVPQPERFVGDMRPYQVRGLSWLMFMRSIGFGCILADDMGLGKTIQAISYVLKVKEVDQSAKVLVIAPVSLITNWKKELNQFSPSLRVLIHHGSKRDKGPETAGKMFADYDVVITSNEITYRDLSVLNVMQWSAVVLDEAQNFKNHLAKRSVAIRKIHARHRIALTGTPVENRLTDLWAIMDFLNPGYLYSRKEFKQRWENPFSASDKEAISELQSLIRPFILRREKNDKSIISDLPEKNEMTVYCGLTEEQAALYQAHIDRTMEEISESEGIERKGKILSMILRLKQICDHPLLYLGKSGSLVKRSEKLDRIGEMISEIIDNKEKAVIFTQFASMGRIIKKYLDSAGISNDLYHGGLSTASRDRIISSFRDQANGIKVLVASLKAGGLGLNLTEANNVFHFDRWWNPAVENQATDRLYRIGQKRNVQVYKFVVAGTLEEKIEEILRQKSLMAGTFIRSGEEWLTELSTSRIRELVKLER